MGDVIKFARVDGKDCPGYLALPEAGANAPAIVVIQEWWGLNEQITKVADRLASEGFRALVPDLFRGKITKDAGEANHMMTSLNFMDATDQDIRGAARHLKEHANTPVAVLGFCMGGALTILSALRVEEVAAGVCFYGIPPFQAGDPAELKKPMLFHFATRDDWCTPAFVNALEQKLSQGKVDFELHRYEANHAFANEHRPEVYDAKAADLAWSRTLAFLKQRLRASEAS